MFICSRVVSKPTFFFFELTNNVLLRKFHIHKNFKNVINSPVTQNKFSCPTYVGFSSSGDYWYVTTMKGVFVFTNTNWTSFSMITFEHVSNVKYPYSLFEGYLKRTLLLSLRLKDTELTQFCLSKATRDNIGMICQGIPPSMIPEFISIIKTTLETSNNLEITHRWITFLHLLSKQFSKNNIFYVQKK